MDNRQAHVDALPSCDFCEQQGIKKPAKYDGRTNVGAWANMCQNHFFEYGVGLGLGKGQKLIVNNKK